MVLVLVLVRSIRSAGHRTKLFEVRTVHRDSGREGRSGGTQLFVVRTVHEDSGREGRSGGAQLFVVRTDSVHADGRNAYGGRCGGEGNFLLEEMRGDEMLE